LWISLTELHKKRPLRCGTVQIRPAVAMRLAAPIPVEMLGDRAAPVTLLSTMQPKVPILEPLVDGLVVASDRQVDGFSNRARRSNLIFFQECAVTVKPFLPQILLGAKADSIPLHKSEFWM